MRPSPLFASALALLGLLLALPAPASRVDFPTWLEGVATEARDRGISDATIDASFAGVAPIDKILKLDRSQPRKPAEFCGYMSKRLTDTRIARGRTTLASDSRSIRVTMTRRGC